MQSTETDDQATPADVTPATFKALEYQASLFLLRKTEDELHAALSALEAQKSLALTAASALAAERDRADRAEARIKNVAPHDDDCRSLNALGQERWPEQCNCWKSEATA